MGGKGKQKNTAEAIEFWQTRASRELSDEDARQIAENITGFFELLLKWEAAEQDKPVPVSGPTIVATGSDHIT